VPDVIIHNRKSFKKNTDDIGYANCRPDAIAAELSEELADDEKLKSAI
jgi:hypothetical protein